jgi:hypothetical protein
MSTRDSDASFVTFDNTKSGEGMVPAGPCHVAVVISLTADKGVHVGISSEMVERFGKKRCDALTDELADAIGVFFAVRQ